MSFALQKIPSKWTNWITYPPAIPYLGAKLISESIYFISLQATKRKKKWINNHKGCNASEANSSNIYDATLQIQDC